jgi:hypothetical protein
LVLCPKEIVVDARFSVETVMALVLIELTEIAEPVMVLPVRVE